jgi:hypothetical protein
MCRVDTLWRIFGLLACAAPVSAQCSMCRTAQSALPAGVIDAAIVVLFVPAIALFCGIFMMAYRSRTKGPDTETRFDED